MKGQKMKKLYKTLEAVGGLNKNKVIVGEEKLIGFDRFIHLNDGTLIPARSFKELDQIGLSTRELLVDATSNFTPNKVYDILSTWESSQNQYHMLKNDIGIVDYLSTDRFDEVPATQDVPHSDYGYVKCVSNHKPAFPGQLKKVKRITEGKVYPLTRPASASISVYWVTNDVGNEEDFVKSRMQQVVPQSTSVNWVPKN